MSRQNQIFLVIVTLACIVGFYLVSVVKTKDMPAVQPEASSIRDINLPDFSVISPVTQKKDAFFNYMLPFIQHENQRLLTLRQELLSLELVTEPLNKNQKEWLQEIAIFYRVKDRARSETALITQLLLNVDLIPPSLALAQSANESAWGSSRFAVKGNNLFGQWCFQKGCGMVPQSRDSGASHEVASFSSPRQSVESYMHNLNSNQAYFKLRKLRASIRQQRQVISGADLLQGLMKYSSRGDAYIDELKQMILINKLDRYDII
jgi:Bax protein